MTYISLRTDGLGFGHEVQILMIFLVSLMSEAIDMPWLVARRKLWVKVRWSSLLSDEWHLQLAQALCIACSSDVVTVWACSFVEIVKHHASFSSSSVHEQSKSTAGPWREKHRLYCSSSQSIEGQKSGSWFLSTKSQCNSPCIAKWWHCLMRKSSYSSVSSVVLTQMLVYNMTIIYLGSIQELI